MKKLMPLVIAVAVSGCAIKPQALQPQDVHAVVNQDISNLRKGQEPITAPLSLGNVIARTVHYNLQYRTQRLAQALANGQFELAKFDMLPMLAAEAGYLSRNNYNASRSISVFTGNETLEPSTSQEKDHTIAGLRFSWNILDFGVSYYQAKQEADRFLIGEGARKKLLLNLMQEARTAYWNALAAQEIEKPLKDVLEQSRKALQDINGGLKAKVYRKPLQALKLKRQLLGSTKELEALVESVNSAKIVLANLINAPMHQPITLQGGASLDRVVSRFQPNIPVETLETTALANSTDVAEQIYNTRIQRLEARKALLRLLPGIEFGVGANYDSNKFLMNDQWNEASLRVTWNLMRLASTSQVLKNNDVRVLMIEQKRMAVSMAVIAKLNLALQQIHNANNQLAQAYELRQVDEQIARFSDQGNKGRVSVVDKITATVGSLQTRVAYYKALAAQEEAKGALFVSLGISPIPNNYHRLSVADLSAAIDKNMNQWDDGVLPVWSEKP